MASLRQMVDIAFNADVTPLRRVVNHVNKMERGLYSMNRSLDANSRALSRNQRSAKKFSDQGLANIQAGLVQLSTYMMLFNQRLDNMFEKATNRFSGVDESLTQLRITMGLTGERSIEALRGMTPEDSVLGQYDAVTQRMAELARTTQFTNKELVDVADTFKKTGRNARETMVLTDLARQLSSASAGAIDLSTATDMVNNSIYAFNGNVDAVPLTLDRMVKGSQTLNMSLTDVSESFKSLSGAMSNLDNSRGDADAFFVTMLAGYKSLGKSPREAADSIKQSMNSVLNAYSKVDKEFLRSAGKMRSLDQLKKVYTSRVTRNAGRNALLAALGLSDANSVEVTAKAQEIAKQVGSTVTTEIREAAKDALAKELLSGFSGKMTPREFVKFLSLSEKRLKALGSNDTEVASRLKSAFGAQALPTMLKAMKLVTKDGESFGAQMDKLIDSFGTLDNAAKESLKSLSSRIKLAESAEDALMIAIMREDAIAKGALETYTSLISASTDFMDKNPKVAQSVAALGRALQYASGIMTNVGFALVAMATFSIGATYAFKGTGMAALSLGRIMAGFYSVFLAPTLIILVKLGVAVALLSAAFVGFIRYTTGAKTVSEGMVKVFDSLNQKIKIFSGFMGLYNSEMDISSESMKEQVATSQRLEKLQEARLKLAMKYKQGGEPEALEQIRKKYQALGTEIDGLETKRQGFLKAFGVDSLIALKQLDAGTRDSLVNSSMRIINVIRALGNFIEGFIEPLGMGINLVFNSVRVVLEALFKPVFAIAQAFGYMGTIGDMLANSFGFLIGSILSGVFVFKAVRAALNFLSNSATKLMGGIGALRNGISALRTQMELENQLLQHTNYLSDQSEVRARKLAIGVQLLTGKIGQAVRGYRALNQELERQLRLQAHQMPSSYQGPLPRYGRRAEYVGGATVLTRLDAPTRAESVIQTARTEATAVAQSTSRLDRFTSRANRAAGAAFAVGGAMSLMGMAFGMSGGFVDTLANGLMVVGMILPMLTTMIGFLTTTLGAMGLTLATIAWPILAIVAAGAAIYGLYRLLSPSTASANTLEGEASSGSTLSAPKSVPVAQASIAPGQVAVPRAVSMPQAMGSSYEPTSAISAREVNIHVHEKVQNADDLANMVKRAIKDNRTNIIT